MNVLNTRRVVHMLSALVLLTLAWGGEGHGQELAITPQQGLEHLGKLRLGPGVTVVLKPGVYTGSVALSEVLGAPGKPVVITAEKGAVIESWKDKANHVHLNAPILFLSHCDYVEVRNLDMSGAVQGINVGSCTNITLAKNSIHDMISYGIITGLSSGTTIEDNVIERITNEHGIYISGEAANLRVRRNVIRDTHINGIHCNGNISAPIIEKNTLERTGYYPTKEGGAGITLVGGASAPLVRENVFKNIHGQGVTVGARDAVITENTFESYSWSGVLALPSAENLTITNNKFLDPTCIPFQFHSSAILGSVKAVNNVFAVKSGKIYQDSKTEKVMTIEQWKALGKN